MAMPDNRSIINPSSVRRKASLDDSPDVEGEEWYHGFMPREEINHLLVDAGDFILRQTELTSGQGFQLVLSVKVPDRVVHFPVSKTAENRFYVSIKNFDSVAAMVKHYVGTREEINETHAKCLNGIRRQSWELHKDQITVGDELGKGEYGMVHRGELRVGKKSIPVAVKLHKVDCLNKEKLEEFHREARILREYQHPNIVKFYGVSFEQQPVMLCMELADGGSLDKYLKKHKGTVGKLKKLQMCVDAAAGLAYIHAKNTIHRDVAARNCLVSAGKVKISDFGLATKLAAQFDEKAKGADINKNMPIRWLAPEAMLQNFSIHSDTWSFGVLVWEVFTDADVPYKDKKIPEVFKEMQRKTLKLEKPHKMPDDVWKIITTGCFRRDPANRYPMRRVHEELEKAHEALSVKKARKSKDDTNSLRVGSSKDMNKKKRKKQKMSAADKSTKSKASTPNKSAQGKPGKKK